MPKTASGYFLIRPKRFRYQLTTVMMYNNNNNNI